MLGGQPITAGESDGAAARRHDRRQRADDGSGVSDAGWTGRACRSSTPRRICATTPARELGLVGHGVLAPEAVADLVVLDANFSVVQTYVAGQLVYARGADTQVRPYTAVS